MLTEEKIIPQYSVIGKPVPRVDALSKVTGAAIYSGDVDLSGMLHAKALRSPYPHALIRRLDVSGALALEGVKAVITADDVPGYKGKSLLDFSELPRLARGKVVYMAQPVAVVAATSLKIAEKALELIKAEYEELPAVLDIEEAMRPGTPPVHSDLFTTKTAPDSRPVKVDTPSNIAATLSINRGDLEAGFQQADIVLENTFRTQKVHHGFLEPIASIAAVDTTGKITVWTQSQGTFMARRMLAEFLDVPVSRIKVMPVEVGGAFGGKTYLPTAPICALLAMKTGRPVRMVLTRDEQLKDGRHAPESLTTVKIGATREGDITAASVSLAYDAGAFPEMTHCMFASHNVLSQYRIPNLIIEAKDVITNKIPSTFYRAPGTPQSHFATESQIDLLARALNMDPLQLRLRNIAVKGDIIPNGEILPRVGFKETLERMAEHLKQKGDLAGKNRGRGVACGFWHGASGSFGAHINVNGDGSMNLVLGITDMSGCRTSVAQIVAEEFCLPAEKVSVIIGDTDTAPWATMSVGSMTTYSLSMAVFRACQDIKAQLGERAAAKLEVSTDDIEFVGGVFQVKGNPGKTVSLAGLAKATFSFGGGAGPIIGSGATGGLPSAPTLSVHAVDLEVDEETGKVKVLSYAVAQDTGKALNPMSIEGQIQGAVTQGIGWALMEKIVMEKGEVQNSNLTDYRLPTATDVPMLDIMIVEVPSETGVYGVRHVGEPPMIGALGAIANALHSATGVRFKETPFTPEIVIKEIRSQRDHSRT